MDLGAHLKPEAPPKPKKVSEMRKVRVPLRIVYKLYTEKILVVVWKLLIVLLRLHALRSKVFKFFLRITEFLIQSELIITHKSNTIHDCHFFVVSVSVFSGLCVLILVLFEWRLVWSYYFSRLQEEGEEEEEEPNLFNMTDSQRRASLRTPADDALYRDMLQRCGDKHEIN